jgi:uncharacterized protein (TIGR03435 family)
MISRLLVGFLVLAIAGAFGQVGMFGPVSVRLRAGDLAPDVVFDRILSSPAGARPGQINLSGRMTVLAFFPDTSLNLQAVTRWNALIPALAQKPVQFVWITAESESSLAPWLAAHPMQGWVVHDPGGATGRSYGLEMASTIFIGADRRIIGFDHPFVPSAETVMAALEGRTTTTPEDLEGNLEAFLRSRKVLLKAEPERLPGFEDHKPDFPPSDTVHIAPAQSKNSGNYGGDNYWSLESYTLKSALAELYNLNLIRIDLPAALDDGKRYDFSLVLPRPEDKDQIYQRFRRGIQDHFHVTAANAARSMDVYVVSAIAGRQPPAINPPDDDDSGVGFSTTASIEFQVAHIAGTAEAPEPMRALPDVVPLSAICAVSLDGTADQFSHHLESLLDRPVVNETNLSGEFAFHTSEHRGGPNDFSARLRDELGLAIEPARRSVTLLVLKP